MSDTDDISIERVDELSNVAAVAVQGAIHSQVEQGARVASAIEGAFAMAQLGARFLQRYTDVDEEHFVILCRQGWKRATDIGRRSGPTRPRRDSPTH